MAVAQANVHELVRVVLETIPPPYTEGVADRVMAAILENPEWAATYHQLIEHHGKYLVDHSIIYNADALAGVPEPPPPAGPVVQQSP